MNNTPLVSVIIINYNGARYLKKCFDSLYAGSYKNTEIIFVDNGSTDSSVECVKDNFPQIRIIENGKNLGLSIASNRGALIAKGEYLFFYNNDTFADKNLISNLVRRFWEDQGIGICGCRTMSYDGSRIINEGVSCDIFGYPFGGKSIFYVDAAIFIKKSIFDKIGGFDEKMFLYGEDRDICWRAWLYGYKVEVEKDAFFMHDSFCITRNIKDYRSTIRKRNLGEFNAMRSICKNYSLTFLAWVLPFFLTINLAEIVLFSLMLRFDIVKDAYIKAYIQNIREWRNLLILRKKIQKERKISDRELIKHMYFGSAKLSLLLKWGIPKFN